MLKFKSFLKKLPKIPSYLIGLLSIKLHDFLWSTKNNATGAFDLNKFEIFLKDIGVKDGSTLFVHSSWAELKTSKFSCSELINFLVRYLGNKGTLAMPAYPMDQTGDKIFNVKKTPSAAGLLTEVFRRYPKVKRSINLNHSVCALGLNADYLVGEHNLSETAWDTYSPYSKLGKIEDAWILGLGVGHRLKIATPLHCVDSVLWKEVPYFNKLFKQKICYKYIDENQNKGSHCYWSRKGQIYTPKLAKYFSKDELIELEIEGVQIYAIKAATLINKATSLALSGKTMYIWPLPFPWLFAKKKL